MGTRANPSENHVALPVPGILVECNTRSCSPRMMAIAVSAYFTAADQERGRDAGFDMHFAKPVDLTGLHRVLERMNSAAIHNGNGAAV